MQNVLVELVADDKLSVEKWLFIYIESSHSLVLTEYTKYGRQTKRHGYKRVVKYDRLYHRDSIPVREVPLHDGAIFDLAKREFLKQMDLVNVRVSPDRRD